MSHFLKLRLLLLVSIALPHQLVAAQSGDAPAPAIEVTAKTRRGEARELQDSAEAVTVIDLRHARQQSADLGEVLARTQGVSVRRTGGLGSSAVVSLNGLQGEQIRTFVDGVPIDLAGYPFGIANIPVNIVERVEIYRGVVPVRFGLDALGGAINVVTTRAGRSYLNASYQAGSFGVHRLNATGRYQGDGYTLGANAFIDRALNNFTMRNRALMQPDGSSIFKDVTRFHDGYLSYGGHLELGLLDKPWARRLLVRAFASTFDKELQTNAVMSVPYGEVTSGETTFGSNIQYELPLGKSLVLEVLLNYAHRRIAFRDMSEYRYRWTGQIARRIGLLGTEGYGEIEGKPYDQATYENLIMNRIGLLAPFSAQHAARVYVTTQYVSRTVHDFAPNTVDWGLHGGALQLVAGLELEQTWLDGRLSNVVFGKYFLFAPHAQTLVDRESLPDYVAEQHRTAHYGGFGDSLRFRFTSWLLGKASYEYAVRMPNNDELFGNGVLVRSNPDLKPERSHNFNVGPRVETKGTVIGDIIVDLNAFWRETTDQIVLIATQNFAPNRNLADARTYGLEASLWWQSPGRWVTLDGSFTRLEARNTSEEGPFSPYKGERIPSRPYLFASWGTRFQISGMPQLEDTLDVFYTGRFVGGFYRGWESLGNPEYKMSLPDQTAHAVGVTYYKVLPQGRYSCTFEIDNLADADLFDVWGVQRPGRAFNIKLMGQM
jgi:vitamin B12 transporter